MRGPERTTGDPARRGPDDRVDMALMSLRRSSPQTARDRLVKLRLSLLLAVQTGVAAALAWWIANDLLDNPQPVFAPAVAVGAVASSVGHRLRRTLFLVAGVAVGITVGDLLVAAVGSGHVQIGVIVAVSILLAVVLSGGEGGFITQAGGSAMVVAVLAPASNDLALPRFIDGVVGGGVGVLVSLILLPLHPIHRLKKAAEPLLALLAQEIGNAADALAARDARLAKVSLDRLRAADLTDVETILGAADEVVRISPIRRHNRSALQGWQRGAGLMMRSLVQSRPLMVALETAIRHDEPLPDTLERALRDLSTAVAQVHHSFAPSRRQPTGSRRAALSAIRLAHDALTGGLRLNGTNVAAQIKIIAVNTLRATGLSKADAEELEREVAPDPAAQARSGAGATAGDEGAHAVGDGPGRADS
ncbi:FUSC family protein [Micromonospora sp. DT178]|uniref:FUSC family protein n=1 Tax=Micromonospora sp. DT178 TaxID=3393436 RepID=UPI003CFAD606